MKRFLAAGVAALLIASCGGSSSSPVAPSPTAVTAVLAVEGLTAAVETTPAGLTYHVAFHLHETSGRSAATVTAITFTLADGRSTTATGSAVKVAAGSIQDAGTFNFNDNGGATATASMTVTVAFTDDGGRTGSASASTSVTQTAPPHTLTIAGVVTDSDSSRPLAGVNVTATDVTGTAHSSTTDGNGYYSIPSIVAGLITVDVTASGYTSASFAGTLSADTRKDFSIHKQAADVEYRITGTARRCSATYENSSGGTSQSEVSVPFSYSWNGAHLGDFLYMACQIDTGGDQGNITIGLYIRGALVQSANANGFPNIATVSGSY